MYVVAYLLGVAVLVMIEVMKLYYFQKFNKFLLHDDYSRKTKMLLLLPEE
jgi:hypothetical protein